MIFYSIPFFALFLLASVLIHFAPKIKWQHALFLTANVIFYGYWDYRFLLLLMGVVTVCYFAGILYDKKKKNLIIVIAEILCLIVLCVFKYLNFFITAFASAFHISNVSTLNIILPLGVSFYIFQSLSYLIDVKRGTITAEHDYVKLGAYLSFFPQITSGPIVKAHDFLPQMNRLHRIKKENVYKGLQLFLIGLTKKIVIADRIGAAVNAVYSAPLAYNWISILFAILGYSIQIYCDFSGYSDMAIGIAAIWDFDLGKNFNAPYLAVNPSDFWKRWHISLSSWFRDYVYIPLGGNRKGKIRTYFNLFITMVLSGLWHGANITFVVWGAMHGIWSMLHKMLKDAAGKNKRQGRAEDPGRSKHRGVVTFVYILLNFAFVSVAWVVFRADNMRHALQILSGIFRMNGVNYVSVYTVCYAVLLIGFHLFACFRNGKNALTINMNLDKFRNKVIFCVWVFLIIMLRYAGDTAFIYAQF